MVRGTGGGTGGWILFTSVDRDGAGRGGGFVVGMCGSEFPQRSWREPVVDANAHAL